MFDGKDKDVRFRWALAGTLALSVAAAVGMLIGHPGLDSFLVLNLPFLWIGEGLRALSLSGAGGNVLAWGIYGALCGLPVGVWHWRRKKGRGNIVDGLLLLLGLFSLYLWYCFINPFVFLGLLPEGGGTGISDMGLMLLSVTWWGILCAWAVLAVLNRDPEREEGPAVKAAQRLRTVLKAGILFYIIYDGYFQLLVLLKNIRLLAGQQDRAGLLVCGAEGAVGYVLDGFALVLLFKGLELVSLMGGDWYQEGVERLARQMAGLGKGLVYAVMLGNMGLNLLKLFLAGSLQNLNISVVIPFVPLILALAAFILGDYFESSRKQHEDMSMII